MIENLYSYIDVYVEGLTILISFVGFFVCGMHALYFRGIGSCIPEGKKKLFAKRMEQNFMWDSFLYVVTLLMGAGLLLQWDWLVRIDMVARVFVLLLAVIASIRLHAHYKIIHTDDD